MTADELLAFAEGLARVAAGGGGTKALAAHLAAATGCSVVVEDDRRQPVATAGRSRDNGQAGTACEILAGGTRVGWLSLFSSAGTAPDDRPGYAQRLTAAAIAVELIREPRTHDRRTAFWERLASGTYLDATAARDDALARGIVAAPAYVAIVLEVENDSDARSVPPDLRAAAADTFRSGEADVGYLERGNALIVFAPTAREYDASNARTAATLLPKAVSKRAPGARVSGGVGTVEQLKDVAQSVERATGALSIGRRVFGAGRVVTYDELGAYPLLYSGANSSQLREFSQRTLAPLRAYDEKHQTELERTLGVYFQVGQNVKTASERLHVHRHTVFYRLRQIGEICQRSLESDADQLTLRLAVAIHALHA